MVDKELIEIWRNMLKPSISSRLLKTNYEGKGEQDKEEFERDFDEILDLALIGLKHKAQLSQEGTTSDTISRQAAIELAMKYCPDDDGTVQCDGDIRELLDELDNLPPAQPEERTEERTETHACVLISRQAAIDAAALSVAEWDGMYVQDINGRIREALEKLPPAQPERKTGHWIAPKYYPTQFTFTCSKCGYKQSFNGKFKFCPNCGADMRGERNG